jgi:hypothetical protein
MDEKIKQERLEARFNELASALGEITESKKGFILSLLRDFVFFESQIDELRKYPRYIVNDKDPRKQIKLPAHDMLKDFQAQKNDVAVKILRTLENENIEESPLMKALARFDNE